MKKETNLNYRILNVNNTIILKQIGYKQFEDEEEHTYNLETMATD